MNNPGLCLRAHEWQSRDVWRRKSEQKCIFSVHVCVRALESLCNGMGDWQFVQREARCPGNVGLTARGRAVQKNRVLIGTLRPASAGSDKRCQWIRAGLPLMFNVHTCTGKHCPRKPIWSAVWEYTLKKGTFPSAFCPSSSSKRKATERERGGKRQYEEVECLSS